MTDGHNDRFDFAAPLPNLSDLGRVHFVAIGGIGMSAVARIMLERGIVVSGSDARASAVLDDLRRLGARVRVGHRADRVDGIDTLVVSSAVRDDNVELGAARFAGVRVLHRAQALAVTMADSTRVAVAGANGKTTTTSMTVAALAGAGRDPSFAIGGSLVGSDVNARWGSGDVFVAEADESDGSFVVYHPRVAVVTSVQPDHLDFYGSFDAVRAGYADFVASIGAHGLLVACADDPGAAELARQAIGSGRQRVVTYGFAPGADVRLSDHHSSGTSTRTTLTGADGLDHELVVPMPGRHNALNAAAAWAAVTSGLAVSPDAALSGLATFAGVHRRFEIHGTVAGVVVIDDYAHNPAKVAAVVQAARGMAAPGAIHVVFQPHLYSRTRDFAAAFADALSGVDHVILPPVYGAREDPVAGVDVELIADPLRRLGTRTDVVADLDAALTVIMRAVAPGDVVLTVGAGDVTTLAPRITAALAAV